MSKLDKDWVLERLRLLTGHADELEKQAETNGEAYLPMTVLKLAVLGSAVNIYSNVAGSDYECYYLDLLAGAGVTPLRGRGECVIGSPFIATDIGEDTFDEYHFVERNEDRAKALRRRLEYASKNTDLTVPEERCHVWNVDVNSGIDSVVDRIYGDGEYGHVGVNTFSFLDNAGPDVHWDTVEKLCSRNGKELYGDLLVNFPATGVSRRHGKGLYDQIDPFFKSTQYRACNNESEFRELYESDLKRAGKKITQDIRINSGQSGKRFYYDIIYATRETGGGSPYAQGIEDMKPRIERLDGDDVSDVLDFFVHGNQASLDIFGNEGGAQAGFSQFR